MRILHLGKYYWPEYGGVETAVKEIAEIGVELGHQVDCRVAQAWSMTTRVEVVNQVRVSRLATIGQLLSAPLAPYWFDSSKVDVLHVHLPNPVAELAALWAVTFSSRPLRLMPYFHAFPSRQGLIGRLWFNIFTARIFDRSEAILVSNPTFTDVFPILRRWQSKFRVLPFATEAWDERKIIELRPKRSASTDVLTVGRLVKYKGYDILMRAWAKVIGQNKRFGASKLNIVGIGPEWQSIEDLKNELHLEKNVVMAGVCPEEQKSEWFSKAAVFAAPSVGSSETFGISMLEAMGSGLPVVTTRIPTGVALLARDGACGAVVEPGSVDELATALVTLLSDQDRRSDAGQANVEFVRKNYSKAVLHDVYREILG